MENYYFDADGVFTGSAPANPDTLPPPDALRVAPPQRPGHWPVLNAARDGWDLREDHRGRKGWLHGEHCQIATLGPLPEEWSETPPEPERESGIDDLRRAAYRAETDELRDLALSFQAEAEAWRLAGATDKAKRTNAKYRRELARYLEKKEEIRIRYPKPANDDAEAPPPATTDTFAPEELAAGPRFYLTRSGIYHAEGCTHTKAKGEWLLLDEIQEKKPSAKPCSRCNSAAREG